MILRVFFNLNDFDVIVAISDLASPLPVPIHRTRSDGHSVPEARSSLSTACSTTKSLPQHSQLTEAQQCETPQQHLLVPCRNKKSHSCTPQSWWWSQPYNLLVIQMVETNQGTAYSPEMRGAEVADDKRSSPSWPVLVFNHL